MGLAVNSPQIMADHIGAELNFAALLEENIRLGDENFPEAARKFRRNHLERWIPQFNTHLENGADCCFYRALALDTRNFLERGYT